MGAWHSNLGMHVRMYSTESELHCACKRMRSCKQAPAWSCACIVASDRHLAQTPVRS